MGSHQEYQQLAEILADLARCALGENRSFNKIEVSFYGNLHDSAEAMFLPICAGVFSDAGPFQNKEDALNYLDGQGILFKNREVDESKKYGESITLDLWENETCLFSVRGTFTEGKMMISRLNDFDNLYLAPHGWNSFFEYEDKPGVIAKLSGILSISGINIADIRAPQVKTGPFPRSLAAIKTDTEVSDELLNKMADFVNAISAFKFDC